MFYEKCLLLRRYIKHRSAVCQSITWKQYIVESLLDNSWKPADSGLFTDCSCHWPVTANELNFSHCTWTHWVILFPQDKMCQILIFLRHKGIIFLLCFILFFYGPQPWQPRGLLQDTLYKTHKRHGLENERYTEQAIQHFCYLLHVSFLTKYFNKDKQALSNTNYNGRKPLFVRNNLIMSQYSNVNMQRQQV